MKLQFWQILAKNHEDYSTTVIVFEDKAEADLLCEKANEYKKTMPRFTMPMEEDDVFLKECEALETWEKAHPLIDFQDFPIFMVEPIDVVLMSKGDYETR